MSISILQHCLTLLNRGSGKARKVIVRDESLGWMKEGLEKEERRMLTIGQSKRWKYRANNEDEKSVIVV